jgi:Zn-dependent protease
MTISSQNLKAAAPAKGAAPAGRPDPVWRLIGRLGAPWIQWISPFLFVLAFWALCWLPLRDPARAFLLSLALVLQMFLHELGHHLVFRAAGIRTRVWWLFPVGAVAAPVDVGEKAKTDRLPWNTVAWMLQAGVTLNVAAMLAGYWIQTSPAGTLSAFGGFLLLTGGILGISNLIPVWKLDGSLLFLALFSSLKEKDDRRLAAGLAAFLLLAVLAGVWSAGRLGLWPLALAFLRHTGWLLIFALVAAGVWHRQGMDDPAYSASAQAMTRRQAVLHVLLYVALLYLCLRLCLGPLGAGF